MSSSFPADVLDVQVAEHGVDARVVTVTAGEVDAWNAPELADCLTAQLDAAQVVVVDLAGVQFLASIGCTCWWEANELARRENRTLQWCTTPSPPT